MSNFKKILSGDTWTIEFLKKDIKFKIYVFILILAFIIYNQFAPTVQRQINYQQNKNQDLKQRSIYYSSQLMKISLESQVLQEVQKRNIDIKPLKNPPYKIIISNKNIEK